MFGTRWKSWMESHLARVRPNHHSNSNKGGRGMKREETEVKGLPPSSSNDTSILLGPSSSGSFTHNLSSPDTGYSTDGCSPQSAYPHLSFQKSYLSKTSLLLTPKGQNGVLKIRQDSPRRARCRSKGTTAPWISQPIMKVPRSEESKMIGNAHRNSSSSWSDSGQGSMTHRNSTDSSNHRLSLLSADLGLQSTISEEPPNNTSSDLKETDILSDWAPTDEDVDEDMLTPTPGSPQNFIPSNHVDNMNLPTTMAAQILEMPKAYETLQLLNQCNHVFPLPSCTAPRCLEAQLSSPLPKSKGGRGPLGFLRRFFRRKSSLNEKEGQLPEYSRVNGKPIRTTLGGGHWLTPTPNSFRKRTEVVSSTIPKGVQSDIIRLPHTTPSPYFTPTPLPRDLRENWTPTLLRQSPFMFHGTPVTASPASVRFQPIMTPVPIRIPPSQPSPKHPPPPCPPEAVRVVPPSHLSSPSFNNYSPIHRLVVTGVHRHAPESPLARNPHPAHRVPLPPPRATYCPHPSTTHIPSQGPSPLPMLRNPRYQYIPSSNQNSPLLNNPKRICSRDLGEVKGHYYASPLVLGSGTVNGGTWSSRDFNKRPLPVPLPAPPVDRIYERVEGTEGSDEGDGEGGDYEWDLSFGDSEQSSESWRQAPPAPPPHRESFPMQWGTRLSETETKLLEREADLKYKRLLWEAEALLRELSGSRAREEEFVRSRSRPRHLLDETPQSDPLRRKVELNTQ